MKDSEGEKYAFLRLAANDITHALSLLDAYSEDYPVAVQYAILRFAVVSYFRPFAGCTTEHAHEQRNETFENKLKLSWKHVPRDLLSFHRELKSYRDSAFAHTDLSRMNVRIAHFPGHPWEFPMAIKPIDKRPLHNLIAQQRQLFELVRASLTSAIEAIEASIRSQ